MPIAPINQAHIVSYDSLNHTWCSDATFVPTTYSSLPFNAVLTNIRARDSNDSDNVKAHKRPAQAEGTQCPARNELLPGGDKYKSYLDINTGNNPRASTPVPQWLQLWEKKWQSVTGKTKNGGPDGDCPLLPTGMITFIDD